MLTTTKQLLLTVALLLSFSAATAQPHLGSGNWSPDVRQGIDDMLHLYANTTDAYAVFDFDNTCCAGDIADQTIAYQLRHMAFALTPSAFARAISTGLGHADGECADYLADLNDDYSLLYDRYGPFKPEGINNTNRLKDLWSDDVWLDFASKMGMMYHKVYDFTTEEAANTWLLCWYAGMTERELYMLGRRAIGEASTLPMTTQRIEGSGGISRRVPAVAYVWLSGLRLPNEINDLWRQLHKAKIDIWVCSASPREIVCAAVDHFKLTKYCKGIVGTTPATTADRHYRAAYDYLTGTSVINDSGKWRTSGRATKAQPYAEGKVAAIQNAIAPLYHGNTPLAGFMDSRGDFNFCTEFSTLRLVVCFNRGDLRATNAPGLVAIAALHQRNTLSLTMAECYKEGETLYLVQGCSPEGLAANNAYTSNSNDDQGYIFADQHGDRLLRHLAAQKTSTSDLFNTYSLHNETSPLGFAYGFLSEYAGYHSQHPAPKPLVPRR